MDYVAIALGECLEGARREPFDLEGCLRRHQSIAGELRELLAIVLLIRPLPADVRPTDRLRTRVLGSLKKRPSLPKAA